MELTHPWLVHVCGDFRRTCEGGRVDADEAGLFLFPEAVALASDGGGDHGIAEDVAPLAEALVGGQDDAAPARSDPW